MDLILAVLEELGGGAGLQEALEQFALLGAEELGRELRHALCGTDSESG